jgi:hypothetical protein
VSSHLDFFAGSHCFFILKKKLLFLKILKEKICFASTLNRAAINVFILFENFFYVIGFFIQNGHPIVACFILIILLPYIAIAPTHCFMFNELFQNLNSFKQSHFDHFPYYAYSKNTQETLIQE